MTQEEKAKAYDEALHKAKRIINVCVDDNTECRSMTACIQQIFPELKESGDENIRKNLLGYLHTLPNHFSHNGSLVTEWVAWLEKQGGQKPVDKVEPKQDWNEEDKKMSRCIGNAITTVEASMYLESVGIQVIDAHVWLDRNASVKESWKPSDEQIIALRWILNHIPYDSHKEEISGLLEQLKKLREE